MLAMVSQRGKGQTVRVVRRKAILQAKMTEFSNFFFASLPAGGTTSCDKSHYHIFHLIIFLFLSFFLYSFPIAIEPLLRFPVHCLASLQKSQTSWGRFSWGDGGLEKEGRLRRRKPLLVLLETPKKDVFHLSDAPDVVTLNTRKLHWQPCLFYFIFF